MRLEVLWRQLAGTGAEHLILDLGREIHADSLSVGEVDGNAYRVRYGLDCDAAWNVRRVLVEDLVNGKIISLARYENDQWADEAGRVVDAVSGCTDVDIMITPFTNTLPIRRLGMAPGESREIAVVYFGLPALVVSKLEQRYTCLARNADGERYRYESLKTGFSAELQVDTDGLVVDYPNIFEMDAKRRI